MKDDKFFGILYDIFVEEGIFEYEDKAENLNEKTTRIKEFLERAERIDKLVISSKDFMDVVIEDCKNRYVIKEENIPLSYFKKLEEEYFENGSGPLDLTNPKSYGEQKTRTKNVNRIIRNQQISLEKMIKQLYSEETEKLPIWAKLIIFYSALKLGSFNCAKKEFSPRNADSIEPFIEIDMEMLQQCILFAKAALDIEDLEEEKLKEILSPKTMSKLYSNLVGQQKSKLFSNSSTENGPKQLVSSDIQWHYYHRNYSREYTPNVKPLYQWLYDSLQGHNTGWDIAIDIEKTKEQIENSAIHIGFTKDEKGNYTIPRVAYFEVPDYKGDRIEKVIGLWKNQTVEPELQSIVDKIIFSSKSGKKYLSRQNDHKRILTIYNKFQNEETLTKEDLEFLYELDKVRTYNISGDYRIKEILKSRDKKRDLMFVFGCQEKEISLGNGMKYVARVDAFPETTKYHIGKIEICQELKWMQEKDLDSKISTVNLPKELVVGRIIAKTDFIRNINFSKKLIGDLVLTLVKQISKITFPEEVIGDIYLNNISDLSEPMVLPRKLKGNLWLSSLKKEDLRWVTLPEEMEGEISFNASYLRWSLAGLKKIQQELITKEEPSEEISKNPKKR